MLRGDALVANVLGAFGHSLRETRLTAWLGYIFAKEAEALSPLFGFRGQVLRVSLETRHEDGRSDILVRTTEGDGVIEAKVDSTDARAQSRRYNARWRAILSTGGAGPRARDVRHVSWEQVVAHLDRVKRHAGAEFRFLVDQLTSHLKEHHMIKADEPLEIYAREINEEVTLAFFLQAHIYGCDYEKNSKPSRAQYFAPHFGAKLAAKQPGIFQGISYVARIQQVVQASTWAEFREAIIEVRGKIWWNSHQEILARLQRKWSWNKTTHRTFILTGEPRLAFNPPVRKESLQSGRGWLSRRFFSFDTLFAAWGK